MVMEKLSIFQWNCRSLNTNFQYLTQYLHENQHPLVCLTSLNVNWKNLPKITGYYYPPVFSCKNVDEKIGAAIYIRTDIDYMHQNSPIPKDYEDVYSIAVKIKVNNTLNINIVSAYYSKGPKDDNIQWLRKLDEKENYIITGDFNAHSPLWDHNASHTTNSKFVDNVLDSGLMLLNDGQITRVPDAHNQKPSAIDLTLMSPSLAFDYQWYIESNNLGSDHLPIITIINEKLEIPTDEDKVPKYRYNCACWEKYRRHIEIYNKDFIMKENINEVYDDFCTMIHSAAKESIPIKKSCTTSKTSGNIWWNPECEKAVDLKKEAFKEYRVEKKKYNLKDEDNEKFYKKRQANIHSNKTCAEAKMNYFIDYMFKEIHGPVDMPKVWITTNKMKNGQYQPSCPIKIDNNSLPSKVEKAETFASFFSNVSNTVSLDKIEQERREKEEKEHNFITTDNTDQYINASLTLQEVKNAIKELGNKKSAVGLDGISYSLLAHLPDSGVECLYAILQKCWQLQLMPDIWKTSIVIPILKAGKNKSEKSNYRPIALTSHVSKVMEKIILLRMNHHIEKNNIIPSNQCGFRKGKSTTDHIVRLSNDIKHQFSKRKGILATFFDVRKAYDRVWHHRLLKKLKDLGFDGNIFAFISNFLHNRKLTAKVGNIYSSLYNTNMGIPQGSILSPLLFNLLLHDLPKVVNNEVELAQYADDIAVWMKVTIRKKTYVREIKFYEKKYQINIDIINNFMKTNGLEFSVEKTNLILFSNCQQSERLPSISLDGKNLEYVNEVKFLGVIFTKKLCWKKHIEHLCFKAVKSLNLLRYIASKPWGQDTSVLIHLAVALVRSRLTYGQEAYFSAPVTYLNKIKSIDSKAFKIALGVPTHTKTDDVYKTVGITPIDEHRKLSCTKYMVRATANSNTSNNLNLNSEEHYPARSQKIDKFKTIYTYTEDVFNSINTNYKDVSPNPIYCPVPPWELLKPAFDYSYTSITKNEELLRLSTIAKERLDSKYRYHLKIYTDGSVSDLNEVGSGFTIPHLNISRSYNLGKNLSVFTAELVAIKMALETIVDLNKNINCIVFCVDSKSVLQAIENNTRKERNDLIIEIEILIHSLMINGTDIAFFWIPSHCGILFNDWADRLAKRGSKNEKSIQVLISPSVREMYSLIDKHFKSNFKKKKFKRRMGFRQITSLAFRLMLNSWRTKFCKEVKCLCQRDISIHHLFVECQNIKPFLPTKYQSIQSVKDLTFNDWLEISNELTKSDFNINI